MGIVFAPLFQVLQIAFGHQRTGNNRAPAVYLLGAVIAEIFPVLIQENRISADGQHGRRRKDGAEKTAFL